MTVVKNGKKEYRFQDKNGKFHTISIDDDFAVWFEKKKISDDEFVNEYILQVQPVEDVILYMNDFNNPIISNIINKLKNI